MERRPNHRRRRKLKDVRVEPSEVPLSQFRRRVIDITAMLVLTFMVISLGCKQICVGGFSWSDAPIHAMDGVLVHDVVTEWPGVDGLEEWTQHFYARYPCLGLIVYYPPIHAAIQGVAYVAFGIGEGVARGTVVALAVVAVLAFYWLAVLLFDRPSACLAAGLLATAPFGVVWLRQTMLEWPALALVILSAACYQSWYHRPCWRWAVLGGIATTAAVLTKQTAVFLLPLFLTHLVSVAVVAAIRQDWPPGPKHRRHEGDFRMVMTVAVTAMIVLVSLGVYDRLTARYADFSRFLVTGRPPWIHLRSLETYTQYVRWFDEIFGVPFMLVWMIGLIVIIARWRWRGCRFTLAWLVLVWLQQTLVAWKEPRYLFFALPAAALLAGRGWTLLPRWRKFPLGFIPVGCLICYQFAGGMLTSPQRLPDYSRAVRLLAERGDADVVLMDGVRDGQFVFDVRTNADTAGRIITLRGSKVLYSRAARGRWRHTTHRGYPEEIVKLLDHYGIRYVVVESQLPAIPEEARDDWDEPASRVLRKLLADTSRFERIGRFPLKCDNPIWDDVELCVYHYRDAPQRSGKSVTIPIPALEKDVVVDLP